MAEKPEDEAIEEPAPKERAPGCPVIGIGASAGGLSALQQLLPAVPSDCGLAFVVVLHLAREYESAVAQILARTSPIPVSVIADGTPVEPNHAYVIPPSAILTIEDGRLHLASGDPQRYHNSIDTFLLSLAKDQGDNAACIILSGTGSDGTVGLRAIKENGGLTLAQAEAEYDGMMRSAVATGLVDFVLPADKMAAKLIDHFRHRDDLVAKKGPDGAIKETADYLAQICAVIRARTGHDFSGYKDKTIIRRVQRRMQVLQIDEVPAFLDRLRKDPHEADLLFHDLLIGVTSFFRDRQCFEALEKQVIPRLFEGKGSNETVRVWIPGCATGEEAYSLAILLREYLPTAAGAPKVQIFASDIDEHALEVARTGRYPASIVQDVPARRLERYFVREDGTYRVNSDLRAMCLFARHDLLRDAPFSKLDLISCRNLLIYLTVELQSRVIPLFHYALRDGGYLFLGTAENVTRHARLFSTVDREHHIFVRRPQFERKVPEFPITPPVLPLRGAPAPPHPAGAEASLQKMAERQLLERYLPAYVIVNADGDLLYSSGHTGKYLEFPPGPPNPNVFAMARRGLRVDLRAALHGAVSHGHAVAHKNVVLDTNGGRVVIDLFVQPLPHDNTRDYMVVFRDVGAVKPMPEAEAASNGDKVESADVQQLEAELKDTKERLESTGEELEAANEELKSRNEELSSMNEELQSSNEELETSKEELQSINEELQTVNAELKMRVDELSRANNDMVNLLESTQIAAVFLDRNLSVKSFTPAAKDLFHLVESDTGRPIADVRARFKPAAIDEDSERVLRTLGAIERRVEDAEGNRRYIMRVLPYRTVENVIAGVVITFVDVAPVVAAEARAAELAHDLQNRVDSLEALLDTVPVGIFIVESADPQLAQVNRYGSHLLGKEAEGGGLRKIAVPLRLFANDRELSMDEHPLARAARSGQAVPAFEGRLLRADGSALPVWMSATPLFDEENQPRGAIAAVVDISQRKAGEGGPAGAAP